MLSKEQVMNEINQFEKEHGIPKKDILIFAGSALVMRGLRDACVDIDLGLPKEECIRLQELEGVTKAIPRLAGHMRIEYGLLDVGDNTYPTEMLDGYMVQTLESLLELKLSMNREKDQSDIVNLKRVLNVV